MLSRRIARPSLLVLDHPSSHNSACCRVKGGTETIMSTASTLPSPGKHPEHSHGSKPAGKFLTTWLSLGGGLTMHRRREWGDAYNESGEENTSTNSYASIATFRHSVRPSFQRFTSSISHQCIHRVFDVLHLQKKTVLSLYGQENSIPTQPDKHQN